MKNKMETYCDYCGDEIVGIKKQKDAIGDEDNFWRECYDKLEKEKINSLKGFKKIWCIIFYVPTMPFYYREGMDFCNREHYEKWKVIFAKKCEEQNK